MVRKLPLLALIASLAYSGAANAQSAPAANDSASNQTVPDETGDIVVTAQKRSESLQAVPAAVSAIAQDTIANAGVVDQSQLSKLVPGVQVGGQSTTGFAFIRGVGQTIGTPNIQPAVSVNMNGVYLPREAGATPLFDMARVEVLPGPQGTLWGRNAAGGAINFVTERPTDQLEGFVTAEVANYSGLHLTAAANVPLSDGIAFRVAADRSQHDAWCACGIGDYGNTALRGSLKIDTSDRWSLNLLFQYDRRSNKSSMSLLYDASNRPKDFYNPPAADRVPDTIIPFLHEDTKLYIAQAELNYKLSDAITLTVLPGYVNYHVQSVQDFLGNSAAAFGNDVDQVSGEVRLTKTGGKFEWVLGAYADRNKAYFPINPIPPYTSYEAGGSPIFFSNNTKSIAFFGEATYHLTDKLRLTGGLRYSNDKFSGFFRNDLAGYTTGLREKRNTNVGWKGQIQYDLTPENLLYATVQTGYIMGGFDSNPAGTIISPEKLVAYTIGAKNRFFDRVLTLNAELFYYDYKNYHLQSAAGTPANPIFVTNQTPAIVKGIELTAIVRVGNHDRLTGSALLQSAEVSTKTLTTWNGQSMNGLSLPNAPYTTLRGSWEHTFPLSTGAEVVSDISAYYNSGYYQEPTHHPNSRQDAYTLIDANLTYKAPNDRWRLTAFVQNLTDKPVMVGANTPNTYTDPAAPFLLPPRTYGARLTVNF